MLFPVQRLDAILGVFKQIRWIFWIGHIQVILSSLSPANPSVRGGLQNEQIYRLQRVVREADLCTTGEKKRPIRVSKPGDERRSVHWPCAGDLKAEYTHMYAYRLLETGRYYLIREYEQGPIRLLQVMMQTDRCVLIQRYGIPVELEWRLLDDPLQDILECLSEDQVRQWQHCFRSYEDAYLQSGEADDEED